MNAMNIAALQTKTRRMKKMFEIEFEYRDIYSNWEWRRQSCIVSSVAECIRIYDLGVDCDYRIISVTKIDKGK